MHTYCTYMFYIWTRNTAVVHTASQLAAIKRSAKGWEGSPRRACSATRRRSCCTSSRRRRSRASRPTRRWYRCRWGRCAWRRCWCRRGAGSASRTFLVVASPATTWSRERVARAVGRGGSCVSRWSDGPVGVRPVVGDCVGHHDRHTGSTDAGGDRARDDASGATAEQRARRASRLS